MVGVVEGGIMMASCAGIPIFADSSTLGVPPANVVTLSRVIEPARPGTSPHHPARRGAAGLPVAAPRGRPAAPARRVLSHPGWVMTLLQAAWPGRARPDPKRPALVTPRRLSVGLAGGVRSGGSPRLGRGSIPGGSHAHITRSR